MSKPLFKAKHIGFSWFRNVAFLLWKKLNVMSWDLSRGTLAKFEAQIRCVADYEIPVFAASVSIEPSKLLNRAIAKAPKGGNQ